ncbi:MAG: cupin domain-containing protein [Hyphomonadaceae bacterium]|nr:cupin domain-containing protein [Hyphomonadaceae bacterium]
MSFLHRIDGSAPAEVEPIAPDRLVEGAPTTRTTLDYVRGDTLFCGEWSAGVGAWRVRYDEWEFCHMLEGACELTPEGGAPQLYEAGDSFVIEPGFTGVWRVIEPMRKRFVIQLQT